MNPAELKNLIRESPATDEAAALLDAEIKQLTNELNPRLARRNELVDKQAAIRQAREELSAGVKPAADTQQAMPKVATSRKPGEMK